MFGNGRRRGRIAALAAAGMLLVIGTGACGKAGADGAPPSQPASQPAAQQASAQAAVSPGATKPGATQSAVPWQSVGPGWVLDTYSTGTMAKPAPTTLYLLSPAGAKYPLLTWPASATPAPLLWAWAGDKTEALFQLYSANGQPDSYGELNLMTGAMTRVGFSTYMTTPIGYTVPDGQQIVGFTQSGANDTISRYTQAGALVQALVTVSDASDASYSPDGTALAVPAPGGLDLVSNAGGVIRKLPVPGVSAKFSCQPARWWNADTILASCLGLGRTASPELWLVPASGASVSQLTPARPSSQAPWDLGDIGAWQLPSGLYLQSLGPCGTLEVNEQASDGALTRVTVPGMTESPVVLTASGTQLLVEQAGCHGGSQLAWYNPATGAELWLFKNGAGPALAYNDPEDRTIH